jgi:hypothetical protein
MIANKGWIHAELITEHASIAMDASYLSDGPLDFVSSVRRAVEGEHGVTCSWQEEPGTYRFQFQPRNEEIEMTIYFFEESFSNQDTAKGSVRFHTVIPKVELARGTLRGFDRFLYEIDEETYLEQWSHPAPIVELDRLREALKRLPIK